MLGNLAVVSAVAATGANAMATHSTDGTCTFTLNTNGAVNYPVGQPESGQAQAGKDINASSFTLGSDGSITDDQGRGCWWTPPGTVLQCDSGQTPETGFDIGCDGSVTFNGQSTFYECDAGNGLVNIYKEAEKSMNCAEITLTADGCSSPKCGATSSSAAPASSSAAYGSSTATWSYPAPSSSAVPAYSSPASESSTAPWGYSSSTPAYESSTAPWSYPSTSVSPSLSWTAPAGTCETGVSTVYQTVTESAPAASQPAVTTTYTETVSLQPSVATVSQQPSVSVVTETTSAEASTAYETISVPASTPAATVTVTAAGSSSAGVPPVQSTTVESIVSASSPAPASVYPTPGSSSQTPSYPSETPTYSWAPTSSYAPTSSAVPSTFQTISSQPPSSVPAATSSAAVASMSIPAPSSVNIPGSCPGGVSNAGEFNLPHLIIPVDQDSPDTAHGTSYFGETTSTRSSIFNFDIPASDAGKTCNLVFLFPEQDTLETSSFTFSGSGGVEFAKMDSPVSQSTSYSNLPGVAEDLGQYTLQPGNAYNVASFGCPAGEAVSVEMANVEGGDTKLKFFQDYNPCPIGLFMTT